VRNEFGLASLALGILAFPIEMVTLIGGTITGLLAMTLGFVALAQVRHGERAKRDGAVGGIALGIWTSLAVWLMLIGFGLALLLFALPLLLLCGLARLFLGGGSGSSGGINPPGHTVIGSVYQGPGR
jgi:hypothetical protein